MVQNRQETLKNQSYRNQERISTHRSASIASAIFHTGRDLDRGPGRAWSAQRGTRDTGRSRWPGPTRHGPRRLCRSSMARRLREMPSGSRPAGRGAQRGAGAERAARPTAQLCQRKTCLKSGLCLQWGQSGGSADKRHFISLSR